MPPGAWSWIVVGLMAFAALVLALGRAVRRHLRRRSMARVRERGFAGEARAEALLRSSGYHILGRQVVRRYEVELDGRPIEIVLQADFVVERHGQRYVAEAKTGRLAPRIETSATRRQLLEYRMMFDVAGVLLVDAESAQVHRVLFPLSPTMATPADAPGRLAWLLLGMAAGTASTVAVWWRFVR